MGTSVCQVTFCIMFFMSGSGTKQVKIEELNINVYQDICHKLNIPNPGRDYKEGPGSKFEFRPLQASNSFSSNGVIVK